MFTSCGGNYSIATGVLSSPSFPNAYPNLADCVYIISLPNGTYVNITSLFMNLDTGDFRKHPNLTSDYVEMRDGNSEDSPLMARFFGNGSNIPEYMQTTQNHLRIR